MAQKVQVILVDDLDGGAADETIPFSFDGAAYEIDLSAKNAGKLRDLFASYVDAARKPARGTARKARVTRGTRGAAANSGGAAKATAAASGGKEDAQAVRAWAKKKGLKVSERGRISADIIEKYRAAQS